ncbi:MAG: FtsX-like permease family protein [Tepidisphaeraceae bacterium]|jgi:lipoprotein-releasing system permease protein
MPIVPIILWTLVALAPLATVFAVWRIVTGPRLISKLMFRYLMKRRIAWVSLVAVILCTAMVLIVISVMGGWLRMFRQTNHDLIGDLIVYRLGLDGFEHYQEMIDEIRKIPDVKAATPTIHSYGLVEIGLAHTENPIRNMVDVVGLDIRQIGDVNGFVKSLHLQKEVLRARADALAAGAAQTQRDAATRISAGDNFEPFDPAQLAQEESATADSLRAKAASFPSWDKPLPDFVYREQFPQSKRDPATWGGIIVGSGVIGLRSDDPRESIIYKARVKLTVLKVNLGESGPSLQDQTSTDYFWLTDDSHTGFFQADQATVYLPFDVLQKELGMGEHPYTTATGETGTEPARCTEILISLRPDADSYSTRDKVSAAVNGVLERYRLYYPEPGNVRVETWDQHQQYFLSAVEHEKSLLVILFAIISVVAIFLIFCIFFMIVMEKTRDIGIVKSVGATSSTVAAIFLGYGLSIGIFGGGMGLLLAFLVVHYINQLHASLAYHTGYKIWDAKTYMFDTIPNTMDHRDVVVIVSIAILSSVLGALVPAIRAARMNPVEALRWE